MDRAECYKGKTLKEVTADLKIPIKDFLILSNMRNAQATRGIYIYIYSRGRTDYLYDNKQETNMISIEWEKDIDYDKTDEIARKYGKNGWSNNVYNYFKDMKIKEIEVMVFSFSKYYSKYNKD